MDENEPPPIPLPQQPLDEQMLLDLAASMARHPAGKKLPRQCPVCGHNLSGALGDS